MTYLVNDKCIKCKLTDCFEVCHVDCFYEGKNILVIDNGKWLEVNKKYSDIWPNISEKKDPPVDHEKFKDVKNKYEKYFKENLE